jgi:hypothetical protein
MNNYKKDICSMLHPPKIFYQYICIYIYNRIEKSFISLSFFYIQLRKSKQKNRIPFCFFFIFYLFVSPLVPKNVTTADHLLFVVF